MVLDNFAEIMYSGILEGIHMLLAITEVRLLICGLIGVWIIKLVSGRLVYSVSILTGDTQRQARRKVKKTHDIIDLVSAVNDLKPPKGK